MSWERTKRFPNPLSPRVCIRGSYLGRQTISETDRGKGAHHTRGTPTFRRQEGCRTKANRDEREVSVGVVPGTSVYCLPLGVLRGLVPSAHERYFGVLLVLSEESRRWVPTPYYPDQPRPTEQATAVLGRA